MPEVLFIVDRAAPWLPPLASALIARGWRAAVLAPADAPAMPGLDPVIFDPGIFDRGIFSAQACDRVEAPHHGVPAALAPMPAPALAPALAKALATGRAAARSARDLAEAGHRPDLLIGDPAAGAMLFLDAALGPVPQIQLGEGWSRHGGGRIAAGPTVFPDGGVRQTDSACLGATAVHMDQFIRPNLASAELEIRIAQYGDEAPLALSHVKASAIVVPGRDAAALIPACFQSRLHVIEDPASPDPARGCPPDWLDLIAAVTGRTIELPVTMN
jgi:hypothetical protein